MFGVFLQQGNTLASQQGVYELESMGLVEQVSATPPVWVLCCANDKWAAAVHDDLPELDTISGAKDEACGSADMTTSFTICRNKAPALPDMPGLDRDIIDRSEEQRGALSGPRLLKLLQRAQVLPGVALLQ